MADSTTIALLGATGATGRIVLRRLLDMPNIDVKIYVRSKSKLLSQHSNLHRNGRVTIYEGVVSDVSTFTSCLEGAGTIICTLGGNDNRPARGLRDGASSIVSALTSLRSESKRSYQPPHVLLLSSMTWNETMQKQKPWVLQTLIEQSFWYCYEDLLCAHKILGDANELLRLQLIQPTAIVDDRPSGPLLSSDYAKMVVTYEDLAEAFVTCATESQWQQIDKVVVSSKDGDASGRGYGLELAKRVVIGLSGSYIPGFWKVHDYVFG
ncbi:hypothetical protein BDZ85DRAFT_267694 [Elsinoe ampelina]|uniref:NAD(P)-binding domain-containing protein n=1 Tax=Elsinoe ampelina TaxID=302913 RepID=A0A6A6G299_9PEZI|nr:hypothetical protein BDZ85DRAFT_267694 [Elsinoe ampelina]